MRFKQMLNKAGSFLPTGYAKEMLIALGMAVCMILLIVIGNELIEIFKETR